MTNETWGVSSPRDLEDWEVGSRVEVVRDCPGYDVAIHMAAPAGFIHDTGGDVDAPIWRVGDVDFETESDDPNGLSYVRAFTILDTKPGWVRFGPAGEKLIQIRRRSYRGIC